MGSYPFFQVDAFAARPFEGNPAAVVLLDDWLPAEVMLAIAAENNLSETAFVVQRSGENHLRWFTPGVEVDLCGHATLGAATVMFHEGLVTDDEVRFSTRSGVLSVRRSDDAYVMDFPARFPKPIATPVELTAALRCEPQAVVAAKRWMAVFSDQERIEALNPDFPAIAALDTCALIVTAPGRDCDFVSRYFAPGKGVDEDPVTGSAHCTLTPYWADRLGRTDDLTARQLSSRGGSLRCTLSGDRVLLKGNAVLFASGSIHVPQKRRE